MAMTDSLEEKLVILGESARYDASCASSGSSRNSTPKGLGTTVRAGVCHSWTADGRCVSLLKVLQSSHCVFDCAYCAIRRSADVRRTVFTPEELSSLTASFYARNYIEGLFLSSGVFRNPDFTMELMIRTVRLLRQVHAFRGYIHMKIIPGASPDLVKQAGLWSDRLSANIELPSEPSLKRLAPEKSYRTILTPMRTVHQDILENRSERLRDNRIPAFSPAGQSTQMIVGASPDPDLQILRIASRLYSEMKLKRVYYSAFIPVNSDPRLPSANRPVLLREHRLYQSDWLIRFYGFTVDELLDTDRPDLDERVDPKTDWALRHLDRFPVELNTADRETLLRVPGLGIRGVEKIIACRRHHRIRPEDLTKLRIATRRTRHFVTADGKFSGPRIGSETVLRELLEAPSTPRKQKDDGQLLLFPLTPNEDVSAVVTGEL
jgi:putative DNA modification/repair radical SAM protein